MIIATLITTNIKNIVGVNICKPKKIKDNNKDENADPYNELRPSPNKDSTPKTMKDIVNIKTTPK